MAELDGERGNATIRMHQTVQPRLLRAGFGQSVTHHDESAWQDLQVIAGPSECLEAAFHIGVEELRIVEIVGAAEYNLRRLGRELTSGLRRSGLDDDWPALDGTGNIQRPPHREMRPFMIQHMHLLGV